MTFICLLYNFKKFVLFISETVQIKQNTFSMLNLEKDKTVRETFTIPESIVKRLNKFNKEHTKISKSRLVSYLIDKHLTENKY